MKLRPKLLRTSKVHGFTTEVTEDTGKTTHQIYSVTSAVGHSCESS